MLDAKLSLADAVIPSGCISLLTTSMEKALKKRSTILSASADVASRMRTCDLGVASILSSALLQFRPGKTTIELKGVEV